VVGGIYSPTHQNGRFRRLSVDARTGQSDAPPYTVWCASHVTQPLGFDRWSSDRLGHRTVTIHCLVRLLALLWLYARWPRNVHVQCSLLQTTVGAVVVAPQGTPDSLVQHRTVRWIIAEWLSKNPKLSSSELISLVHRTLSGAPDQGSLRFLLLLFFEPYLGLFIGLCWTFGTCRTYNLEQTS
jgi:hypothetical protein